LKPRYILFYIGLNDFYKNEGNNYDALISSPGDKSRRQIVMGKSALVHLFRTFSGIYQAEFVQKIGHRRAAFNEYEWTQTPLLSSYDKLMEKKLKGYSERLEVLIAKTKGLGSVPIFVTQPSRKYRLRDGTIEGVKDTMGYENMRINGVDYYYMMRKLDGVTCSVSREQNLLCIDMAEDMICEDDCFYDFAHMTPKGAKRVGEYLFERLKDKL
jgi:hypothetical protein